VMEQEKYPRIDDENRMCLFGPKILGWNIFQRTSCHSAKRLCQLLRSYEG